MTSQNKFYKTREFKALQKQWYRKLKNEGFRDIELDSDLEQTHDQYTKDWPGNRLKTLQASDYTASTSLQDHPTTKYYSLAQDTRLTYSFKTQLDRRVWDLHTSGFTNQAVADRVGVSKKKVFTIIARIRADIFGFDNKYTKGVRTQSKKKLKPRGRYAKKSND